jgi:hypothetical protein
MEKKTRYWVKPVDDFKAWSKHESLEEARKARTELAMSFFSRRVHIIDGYTGEEVQ